MDSVELGQTVSKDSGVVEPSKNDFKDSNVEEANEQANGASDGNEEQLHHLSEHLKVARTTLDSMNANLCQFEHTMSVIDESDREAILESDLVQGICTMVLDRSNDSD